MSLPAGIAARLRLPLIAAPMLRVSGPDLVIAACRNGVIGAFPTANAGAELDAWLTRFAAELSERDAPVCPNLIMRREALAEDVAILCRHKVSLVITSVGSPRPVIAPLHDRGCLVLADVASIAHAEKALEAGADGLVLLSAGAGGQTGWANGFAFVRVVRGFFQGPLVLAGGISDGTALRAAEVLGADLGYMGTRFIAASESMASEAYRSMLVASRLDDVTLTRAFTGLPSSMLRPSITAAGLDPDRLDESVTPQNARALYGGAGAGPEGTRRWRDIWSAGHSVGGVEAIEPAAAMIARVRREYEAAAPASRPVH